MRTSYHECPRHIAAQRTGSKQETLCGHDFIQIQRGDKPPAHQLQIKVDGWFCKSDTHMQTSTVF